MRHAVRNPIHRFAMDDELMIYAGPAFDGTMLEVGVVGLADDDPAIIHAMPLRAKFYRLL